MRLLVFLTLLCSLCLAEENFILINGHTQEVLIKLGPSLDLRVAPCSTFKIPLSLMGFDAGILKDESTPIWDFQEGYDDFLPSWRLPQTPTSWMKQSCVWYSKILFSHLGLPKIQDYLRNFQYGNQDLSGADETPWINSSLLISPNEQVNFLQNAKNLTLSKHALEMTRSILYLEELPGGWKLFGKTGWGGRTQPHELGWFIGWIEKETQFFPFAYNIRKQEIDLSQRIPRVKILLLESTLMRS